MKNYMYLRSTVKPKNMHELWMGIKEFWKTMTPEVCKQYVGHLRKVIPKVIEVDGAPSGSSVVSQLYLCIDTCILI